MHLIIGLGPIGGSIGARLAELGRRVYGNDFNEDRVREWSEETQSPAATDLAAAYQGTTAAHDLRRGGIILFMGAGRVSPRRVDPAPTGRPRAAWLCREGSLWFRYTSFMTL